MHAVIPPARIVKEIAVYHGSTVANDSCFTVGKLLTMATLTVGIDVGQFLSIVLIIQCESKKSPLRPAVF